MAAGQGHLLLGESGRDNRARVHGRLSPVGFGVGRLSEHGMSRKIRCTGYKYTFAPRPLLDQIYTHDLAQEGICSRGGQMRQDMAEYEAVLTQI